MKPEYLENSQLRQVSRLNRRAIEILSLVLPYMIEWEMITIWSRSRSEIKSWQA
jgi:hypothetical protein